jgi:transposase
MGYEGIKVLLDRAKGLFPRLAHLWMDGGYTGEEKGADYWGQKAFGWSVEIVSRPRKAAPQEVLMARAKEWDKEGVKVDWQKLMPPQGFVVLPRRWVVVRTFSWLGQNRRMSKDCERLTATSEAFIYVAMTRVMVRRLARAQWFLDSFERIILRGSLAGSCIVPIHHAEVSTLPSVRRILVITRCCGPA